MTSDVRVAISEDVVYIFELQLVHRDEAVAAAGRDEIVPGHERRAPDPLISGVVVGLMESLWVEGERREGVSRKVRKNEDNTAQRTVFAIVDSFDPLRVCSASSLFEPPRMM